MEEKGNPHRTAADPIKAGYDFLRQAIAEDESRMRMGANRKEMIEALLNHYDELTAFKANIIEARKRGGSSRSQRKLKSAAKVGRNYGGRKRRLQIYAGILNIEGRKAAYYVSAHDKAELTGIIEGKGGNIDEFRYVKDSEPIGVSRDLLLSVIGRIEPIPRGW
jgi:hypothetical protein